jgi:glycosyltransferase involved in cell wall biosynthesis
MARKKSILIFYEYFIPGYKAGGPVQSLTNLALALHHHYHVYVVTTRYDLQAAAPYTAIVPNAWNDIVLQDAVLKVWYAKDALTLHFRDIKRVVEEVRPHFIYLNGIYTFSFIFKPLFFSFLHQKKYGYRLVVCPRGMLQAGALTVKSTKKKWYFLVMKFFLRRLNIRWHATTNDEKKDIENFLETQQQVIAAANIPKHPLLEFTPLDKKENELRLVFLSLITEKKNLKYLIQLIQSLPFSAQLDIVGPVKDEAYWHECKSLMGEDKRIRYCGDATPEKVQETLAQYHALVLPTKGENFGHAIYESLSVGRPVITSRFTPWNHLQEENAGWNISIDDFSEGTKALQELYNMSQADYNAMCAAAFHKANLYYRQINLNDYYHLFS